MKCPIYKVCTTHKQVINIQCCRTCNRYESSVKPLPRDGFTMTWAYGVTTVPSRRQNLLPRTLASLHAGGFDNPRLFVDGASSGYDDLGLEVTYRDPVIKTWGNWILALWELFIRNPLADRYAIFQDDLICCRNLRQYLERSKHPDRGYLNLYTFPQNQELAHGRVGWFEATQNGFGAVGLVFSNEVAQFLMRCSHSAQKAMSANRGDRAVDGAVVQALSLNFDRGTGWLEYCHNPSLVQHTGIESSMGNRKHPLAPSFPGEDFDALSLLSELPVHEGAGSPPSGGGDGNRFVGTWQLFSAGRLSSRLTINSNRTALRHHAADKPGGYEVVGDDLQIIFPDGHHDLLRREPDGTFLFYGFGTNFQGWDKMPAHSLTAVRQGGN
jgi:hypothetical protein